LDYMTRFTQDAKASRICDSLGYIKNLMADRTSDWEYKFLPKHVDTGEQIDQRLYDELWGYYTTLAEITQNKGVKFVLLGTPVYKTYREQLNNNVVKERNQFVEALQAKYKNVIFLDYLFDEDYASEDFKDASHMSEIGAPKFSKKLVQRISEEIK